EVKERLGRLLAVQGKQPVDVIHRRLGRLMWDQVGMARNATGLQEALTTIPALREEFWNDVKVTGTGEMLNQNLERAGRVADFLEFSELMARDALLRAESCGGHFREEFQTEDGEARRDDEHFTHATVWEHQGADRPAVEHREPLAFEYVHLTQRSYK
ncbi:MAG: fumarate reductase/succinate dehydrogenase flavoprotein subunit, partial [Candidatus Eisenbacteria bacterium]|nr:fumarate reductase/succinate dehydrogenase flavoprotein subunit [Candidatus Eisenbacteria bacterium]